MRPADIFNKTVIVAPLDWGLGHATRCVSIIKQLIQQGNKVVFAGVKQQIDFIQQDFPEIDIELIQGYNVSLDSKRSTYLQMLSQFGKLKRVVKNEKKIAEILAAKHQADIIISDNRYGFRSERVTNIILTHQLQVPLPSLKIFVNKIIRKHIESFDICWIPDRKELPLCGDMILPELKIPKIFIGLLNRFEVRDEIKEFDYLIVISGPEPERTNFTEHMRKVVNQSAKTYCFVSPKGILDHPSVVNPSTKELNDLINKSHVLVSRAGYTTIMEVISMRKKSILVPTKGQFEQEYLASIIESEFVSFNVLESIKL